MKVIYIYMMVLVFGFSSIAQSQVVEDYSDYVFLDKNFKFDGEKLVLPDLKKSFDKPSTCYEDEEPLVSNIKFYDCINKSDSREHDLIISDIKGNSFNISYVNRYGIKNIVQEVKTRAISTEVQNGDVQNQFVCDFDTLPESVYQSVLDLKCHLITPRTCKLLNAIKKPELSKATTAWNDFINHINSPEYKKLFQKKAKQAYEDIFTSVNQNIMKESFNKFRKYNSSISQSTYDIIKEREKTLPSPIKTFDELKNTKDLMKLIGVNMLSKCSAVSGLWDIPSVRDQAQNTKTSTTVGR